VRAFSGNFIIPEQQSGPGGQRPYFLDTPEPGEMRRMTYASIARGADSLLYFRWRTCRFGAEEYWCGILDHDDVPRRRYAELKQIGGELRALGPELMGTSVHVDCAVAASDFDAGEAHGTYPLGLPSDRDIAGMVHRELYDGGYAVGCIHPADDLSGVRLYVVPHWTVFDPAWVPALERWVNAGGTLVVGARTATRDLDNNVVAQTLPGCLRPLLGVSVEEYGKQNRADQRPWSFELGGATVRSEHWYEHVGLDKGTTALATWKERHLAGQCAISSRAVGKGRAFYVGTYLTAPLLKALLPELLRSSGLAKLWPDAPAEVEVVRRESPGRRLWFFMNRGEGEAKLASVPKGTDVLTGKAAGAVTLPRHGVAIIKEH
jgi:beta-galactosidase